MLLQVSFQVKYRYIIYTVIFWTWASRFKYDDISAFNGKLRAVILVFCWYRGVIIIPVYYKYCANSSFRFAVINFLEKKCCGFLHITVSTVRAHTNTEKVPCGIFFCHDLNIFLRSLEDVAISCDSVCLSLGKLTTLFTRNFDTRTKSSAAVS